MVAASSAAVMAVYAAGYVRTRSAAELLDETATARRRPAASVASAPPIAAVVRPAEAPIEPRSEPPVVAKAAAAPASVKSAAAPVRAAEPMALAEAPPVAAVAAEVTPPPPPPPPPPPSPPPPPVIVWKDGVYTGWGTSRHGDIQASVVIENGKIASATISMCLTRYSCSVIEKLPPQVAQRQSAEVDYVSGATQSTNAFYYAVVEALGKAK